MEYHKIEFNEVLNIFKDPILSNYVDNLKSNSPSYIQDYQFYTDGDGGLFGISPDLNIHAYSSSKISTEKFISNYYNTNPLINNIFTFSGLFSNNDRFKFLNFFEERSFDILEKIPSVPDSGFSLKVATVVDQHKINFWFDTFNLEENSNWPTPIMEKITSGQYFLLIKDDILIGALANHLCSDERLWCGRLWVNVNHRKQGFGIKIMNDFEIISKKFDKKVSLTVWKDNFKALRLYEKLGYTSLGSVSFWKKR